MTYSALFCSVVNKFYVLLHFIKYEVVQSHDAHSARDDLRQRTRAAHQRAAFSGTIYRWSRWRPAFLIYTHLRLQHWDIFSWSIRILRCPWCFVYRLWFWYIFDTQVFSGAFLALPQQLVVDRCWCLLSKGYFITSSVFLAIKKATHFWPESTFLDDEMRFVWERDLFLAVLLGHHDALEVLGIDHASVNLELAESVVDFVRWELLTPGHQWVPEPATKMSALEWKITNILIKLFYTKIYLHSLNAIG